MNKLLPFTTKKLTRLALLAALTCICTIFVIWTLPNNGYVHAGDIFIVLAACLFGAQYGAVVGGIGSTMADILVAPVWAPATFIIKIIMALLVGIGYHKKGFMKYVFYTAAGLVLVGGYWIAEGLLFGNWIVPLINSAPFNILQYLGSLTIGTLMSKRLEKIDFINN